MTEKRYFKKMWEEEFYIFDSQTISEKEFDEKVEYEDYQAFADSLMGDEVVDRLNELDKENRKLTNELNLSKLKLREKNEGFDKLHKMYMEQIEENKELKAKCEDYRKLSIQYQQKYNEKISDNTFLEKENKELKAFIKSLCDKNDEIWLDDGSIYRLRKVFKGEWVK